MSRRISVLLAAVAGGSLLLASGCAGPQPSSGAGHRQVAACATPDKTDLFALDPAATPAAPFDNSKLPPAVRIDENAHRLVATRIGVGIQIYDRVNGAWVVREPQANLYDTETGIQRGIHFAGPYWTDIDGSRVQAKISADVDAPDAARNITWLRLAAVENFGSDDGVLRPVTFIQRVLTQGGQPPSPQQGCGTVSVPYTALYAFWSPR